MEWHDMNDYKKKMMSCIKDADSESRVLEIRDIIAGSREYLLLCLKEFDLMVPALYTKIEYRLKEINEKDQDTTPSIGR